MACPVRELMEKLQMTKKDYGKIISEVIVLAFIVVSILVAIRMDNRPRTDDAFLLAYVANLAPDVSGRVVTLNIHDNQMVHAGDVLFVIDPEPYQYKLDAAKAQFKLATSTLRRTKPLLGNGYVTSEQIDELYATQESTHATEELAARDLAKTVVRAPFDGRI